MIKWYKYEIIIYYFEIVLKIQLGSGFRVFWIRIRIEIFGWIRIRKFCDSLFVRAKNRRREHFHNFIKMIEEITALKKTEIERKRERERERVCVCTNQKAIVPYRGVDSKNMRRRTVKKKIVLPSMKQCQ